MVSKREAMARRARRKAKSRARRARRSVAPSQKPGFKGHPFGRKMYTKLKYNEAVTIAASGTAGFATGYKYRLNSLFDPNFTGTGHQPRGYDELMAIFEKYTVVNAKITATFIQDTTVPSVCGIRITDGVTSALTDKKTAIENGNCRWKYMGSANGGSARTTVSWNVNMKKHKNLLSIVGNDDYTLKDGFNPSAEDQVLGEIFVAPVSASDQHGRILVDVTIDYAGVFTEPQVLNQS